MDGWNTGGWCGGSVPFILGIETVLKFADWSTNTTWDFGEFKQMRSAIDPFQRKF